jgi:hypothetical protein
MCKQMIESDSVTLRKIGQILAQFVLHAQFSFFLEVQDNSRSKLFGDGTSIEKYHLVIQVFY